MNNIHPDQSNNTQIRPWVRTLLIVPAYIFFVGFFQFIGCVISGVSVTELNPDRTTVQATIISLFTLTGTSLLIWIFIRNIDKQNICSVGFHKKRLWKDVITGTILWASILFVGFTGLILMNKIH